jgi:hypothetical protein
MQEPLLPSKCWLKGALTGHADSPVLPTPVMQTVLSFHEPDALKVLGDLPGHRAKRRELRPCRSFPQHESLSEAGNKHVISLPQTHMSPSWYTEGSCELAIPDGGDRILF